MIIQEKLKLDLWRREIPRRIRVVQGDCQSRRVSISLYENGAPWEIPADVTPALRYGKVDGTGGVYDTLPDGSQAWSVEGNTVDMMLAPQVMTVPGLVQCQLMLVKGEAILSSFSFHIVVDPDPAFDTVESRGYFNWSKVAGNIIVAPKAQVGDYIRVKTVDKDGVPVEWEAAQPVSGGNVDQVTLTSPDGSKWNLAVDNAGNVSAVKLSGGNTGGDTGGDESGETPDVPDVPEVPVTTYTVTSVLVNVESSNASTVVNEGASYTATLTAAVDYALDTVTVTMGGEDVTASVYADGVINIGSVTGDIIITASAKVVVLFAEVNWNEDTAYVIGQNNQKAYNAWAPGNAVYDRTRGVIVFLQTHTNNHAQGESACCRTLCTVNPYRPMDYTMVTTLPHSNDNVIGAQNSVGGLVVDDDGTWHVYGKKYNYHSNNGGATWTTENVATAPARMYGATKIDGVLYAGDDSGSNNGAYYTSEDNGLNWELKTFDFADDYPDTIKCCEASFCKFNGKIYANLRREMEPGLFARLDESGWVVINDRMPNVSSDTTMYAVDDAIYMAAIDRPNCKLILAYYDGENVITRKEFEFNFSKHGDFHTPTYVVGDDFQMVTFMVGYAREYGVCVNACVVGYKNGVEHYAPTYNVEPTQVYFSDFNLDGPMSGTITLDSERETPKNYHTIGGKGYYNVTKPFAACYPPNEYDYAVAYGFYAGQKLQNMAGSTTYSWPILHAIDVDGVKRMCVGLYTGAPSMKMMGECVEVSTGVAMAGADYCLFVDFDSNMWVNGGTSDFWKTCFITPAE